MIVHTGVTITANIIPGKVDTLKALLQDIVSQGVEHNPFVPFAKVTTAHYARWVIFESQLDAYGKTIPAQLLYSASVEGLENDHIKELIEVGQKGVAGIYACCEGFPQGAEVNDKSTYNYLRKHRIGSTFYSGIVGISLERARAEGVLYERIQSFLDDASNSEDLSQLSSSQVRSKIQDFVRGEKDLQWALKRNQFSLKGFFQIYGKLIRLVSIALFLVLSLILFALGHFINFPEALSIVSLAGSAILGAVLFFAIAVILLMRLDELKPPIPFKEVSDEQILERQSRETLLVQTQYTARENMKPRWIRTVYETVILMTVKQIASVFFIPTVHAARWLQINERRQVIFISNFDGDSEGYLHGFIDLKNVAKSMNLVYGSASGFPMTKWLIGEGANDRQGYMRITRKAQAITNVWYAAIKNLSVENIKNNKRIRKGLSGKLSEEQTEEWLRQF